MQQKFALGYGENRGDHSGKDTTIHKREDGRRAKAIDVGLMILKEAGYFSPRFTDIFPDGFLTFDNALLSDFGNVILKGVEPQAVIHHGAEVWRCSSGWAL